MAAIGRHPLPRFLLLATIGFGFDLALLSALHAFTRLPSAAAVSVAFWVTYVLNFLLNRSFAFSADDRAIGPQLARFVPQVLGDYALTLGAVLALHATGVDLVVARVIAGATNLVFNYTLYRWWTFRRAQQAPEPPAGLRGDRRTDDRRSSPATYML